MHPTTIWILAGISVLLATPAGARPSVKFFCSQNDLPTTVAQTPNGTVTVIRWISTYFNEAGYSPQKRCEEV